MKTILLALLALWSVARAQEPIAAHVTAETLRATNVTRCEVITEIKRVRLHVNVNGQTVVRTNDFAVRSMTNHIRVGEPRVLPPMPPARTAALPMKLLATPVGVDTNPPTTVLTDIRQAVMGDYSVLVPTSVSFTNGPETIDQHSGAITTNAAVFNFHAASNYCYTVWCSSNLKGTNWLEYPVWNFCPVRADYEAAITLPILRSGRRFYQLRAHLNFAL